MVQLVRKLVNERGLGADFNISIIPITNIMVDGIVIMITVII